MLSLNVGDVRNKSHIQIIEKKTGKFKKFAINDRLKPMIENFVKGRRNAEPLFLSHWRHRLDRVTAYYLIRDTCEKAGLQERIGTHSMRKTFQIMFYDEKALALYEEIPDIKVIYYLLTGLSYREIGIRFYYHNTNKVIYQVRKLMKRFHIANRRHLAYFAVKNHLIDIERLKDLQNA